MATRSSIQSWPVIASLGALIGSPLLLVATGQSVLYNVWLAVMMIGLWAAQRFSRREIGFIVGDRSSYLASVGYVVIIIGCVTLGAWAAQLIDLTNFSTTTVLRRLSLNFLITFVLTLLTEDGFFRGALWASCERQGFSPTKTIVWTSLAFGLWHFAVPLLDPDFEQPLGKVPQYVLGSTAFGVAMALLRLRSGSVIVPSACHALWNAAAYTFYGAGSKVGQLGVSDTTIWDPERGYAGLVLTLMAVVVLWRWVRPGRVSVRPAAVADS